MNIAVIGVGGVGGYFGGKLCRAAEGSPDRVHFIARGAHLAAIREQGLRVKTAAEGEWTTRPASVSDRIESLSAPDVVLLCVKSYDLEAAGRRLAGVVSPRTVVVPLMNGVDGHERLRRVLPRPAILPACVFVGTHIGSPGVIAQSGGACRILFGPEPGAPAGRPEGLCRLFERADIKYEWFADPAPSLWGKFIFVAAFGLATAAFGQTMGEAGSDADTCARILAVMGEAAALARAGGVKLPDTIVAESFRRLGDFPPETKTSLQRDVEQPDKPDERDLFGGAILRLGKELGIETPATRELMEMIEKRKPRTAR